MPYSYSSQIANLSSPYLLIYLVIVYLLLLSSLLLSILAMLTCFSVLILIAVCKLFLLMLGAFILQARNLPMTDFFPGNCDPYVWVTLLPDRKHRFKTKVRKHTHQPHWCETFCFEGEGISHTSVMALVLH